MSNPIRIKYFYWLAALLLAFFALNSITLLLINLQEIIAREEDWLDEFYEWLFITAVGLAVLPFLLMAAWRISKAMLEPLRYISRTAMRIGSGAFHERVKVPSTHDEISDLATSVNQAFDRYEEAVKRLDQFSGTASHQLRTPLTAMRNIGEVALQRERSPEEYRETIGEMLEVVDRLARIVGQLLLMAKTGADKTRKQFQPILIDELLRAVMAEYEPVASLKAVTVSMHIDQPLHVFGHLALLQQAVGNLVDNAIGATPAGGRIDLRATQDGTDHIRITVTDTGGGLTEKQAERFDMAARQTGEHEHGFGLGLTIATDLAQLHHGTLHFASERGVYTTVTLRLPIRAG